MLKKNTKFRKYMVADILHHPYNVGVLAYFLMPRQLSLTSNEKFQGTDMKIVD